MMTLLENIHVAIPEMIILITACLALLADLFSRHKFKSIAFYISCIGILVSALVSFLFIGSYKIF
ncbi:TPA: NADH:ubiquinone oxidoreductase subunit N, partial [Legionella pneumophila]